MPILIEFGEALDADHSSDQEQEAGRQKRQRPVSERVRREI